MLLGHNRVLIGSSSTMESGHKWVKNGTLPLRKFYVTFRQSREYLELAGKAEEKRLVENQKRVLELVKENPFIASLKKKSLLRRVAPAKGGRWEVVEK